MGSVTTFLALVVAATAAQTALLARATSGARFERDISRIVFNDNLRLLEQIRLHVGAEDDSLRALLDQPVHEPPPGAIVISVAENRLWYRVRDSVNFHGDLPPDWHYVEQAAQRGVRLTRLLRGQSIDLRDGSLVTVVGSDVVRRYPDGHTVPLEAADGREIVIDGQMIVPPFGTNQRRYPGVLGSHRLILGDGYAIHGTNAPSSIGRSVSHGCVRLLNRDIARLYELVPVGTPVFIY